MFRFGTVPPPTRVLLVVNNDRQVQRGQVLDIGPKGKELNREHRGEEEHTQDGQRAQHGTSANPRFHSHSPPSSLAGCAHSANRGDQSTQQGAPRSFGIRW